MDGQPEKRICKQCGEEFIPVPQPGRPREKCYICSPTVARKWPEAPPMMHQPDIRQEPVDDDEILDWWTAYDRGQSVQDIARAFERPVALVIEKLNELEVLREPPQPQPNRHPSTIKLDQALIERVLAGDATVEEQRIIEALARLRGTVDDLPPRHPVPTIRVSLHRTNTRTHEPMSAHERGQNAMANAMWRRLVASDMAYLGIMPTNRRRRNND